jgi:transposase
VLRIAPLIPPEAPKPKGGRPRVSDRAALTGILFVLETGIPWEYLPAEMGCGSGMTHLRLALPKRRIIPRIARCGIEPKNRLGRYRWVVERTLSWLNRFRRLKIRYEHRADIHLAFLQLGCALISTGFLS